MEKLNSKPSKKRESSQQTWWQPAMVIFSQVTGLIAGPILIALFVGKALDRKYGTEPWIFLGLTGIAFLISSLGIVSITIKYTKKLEKELKDKKANAEEKNNNNQI